MFKTLTLFVILMLAVVGCVVSLAGPQVDSNVPANPTMRFDASRGAFVLTGPTVTNAGRTWPVLVDESVPDKAILCVGHQTTSHREDCTTVGTIRGWLRKGK